MDVYEGIQSEILSTTRFDENSDFSTAYLGKVDKSKKSKIKVGESFPISEQGFTMGKLLDGTECQILLDLRASKSFRLRDEIGACPNVEVEINVTDKSPFFIKPYHVKKEDITIIDKEMKCLCYLGILK